MNRHALFAGLIVATLAAGCQEAVRDANPYPPPPVALAETIPNPPVTREPLMWQPGHWKWTGSGYVWAKGQYVPAAGHGNMWMPGWWSRSAGGWTWQPAHWSS
jgi:hypothetical protein